MTSGFVCSVCRTPVADLDAMSCSNCRVDFTKVGPTPVRSDVPAAAGPATTSPAGWRLPPEFDPSWSRRPWLRRHWRLTLGLALIGSIVAVYAVLIIGVSQMASVPTQRIASDLSEATGGEILSVLPEPPIFAGGKNHFDLFVADNVTPTEAGRLACKVVPGILAQDGYPGISFTLERVGAPDLADSNSPCN